MVERKRQGREGIIATNPPAGGRGWVFFTTRRLFFRLRASGMEMKARRKVMYMGVITRMISQEGAFVLETT